MSDFYFDDTGSEASDRECEESLGWRGNGTMNTHIEIDLNPMSVPQITDRVNIVHAYAKRYVNHAKDHYSLGDYIDQFTLDMKDRSMVWELKREIRRLERLGRGI